MSATTPIRLLLLSGGGHTGANVLASLATRRREVYTIATSDVANEPTLFNHDAVHLVPPLDRNVEGFTQSVAEVVEQERPDLIIPCRDADVAWLSAYRQQRPDRASTMLCGEAAMAEIVNDKWLSYEFCVKHHLPFAASLSLSPTVDPQTFVERYGFPLVAKPRHGVDSHGIVLLTNRAQFERAQLWPDYVVQQFLGNATDIANYLAMIAERGVPMFHSFLGDKRSIQVMIAPDGEVEYVVCTRNVMSGRISRTITVDGDPEPARIGRDCAQVFAANGWRGPLNIQCQPDAEGRLLIHEFNARFTGATSARWMLGIDELGTAIRLFTGRTLSKPSTLSGAPQLAVESLAARAADPEHVAKLTASGQWHGAMR